ncbi:MAG: hypothetical protein JW726_11165 [Anaerolineales bacterium]|nr:hypothetical protein [Anaerolineales bacterium]
MKNACLATLLVILSLLWQGCCSIPAPGGQRTRTVTAYALAYVDSDGDGKQDDGEAPIPDVLILAESNIHGSFSRTVMTTDAQGNAKVSASFTHIFDIRALVPCGYQSTTATYVSVADAVLSPRVEFGFRPVAPESGTAQLRFFFWEDTNRDGVQQDEEKPLEGIRLALNPVPALVGSGHVIDMDALSPQTDATGWAEVSLGNTCGIFSVEQPAGWETTITEPAGILRNSELEFSFGLGVTEITWGLLKQEP